MQRRLKYMENKKNAFIQNLKVENNSEQVELKHLLENKKISVKDLNKSQKIKLIIYYKNLIKEKLKTIKFYKQEDLWKINIQKKSNKKVKN